MLLLAVSLIFIASIVFIAKHLFVSEYELMEREKLEGLMKNVESSLSLNLSYGFDQAVDEIGHALVAKNDILQLQLVKASTGEVKHFGEENTSPGRLIADGHFSHQIVLLDPATSDKVGTFTAVYSKDHYEYLIQRFYTWLSMAIALFLGVLALAISYLVKSLYPLRSLADNMEKFDPENPQEMKLDFSGNDEVVSISNAAENMLGSIVQYTSDMQLLNTELLHSRAHLDEAQHMAHVGSWEYLLNSGRFEMSKEMYRILHLNTRKIVTWESFRAFIIDEDREYADAVLEKSIINGSRFELHYRVMSASGDLVDIQTHGKVRKKGDNIRIAAVSMDVTEQNRTQKLIEKLAYFDALTGLPNRSLFKDRLQKAIEMAQRSHGKLAVLFLDLDHFKLINDTLGHDVGDDLLSYVSDLLSRQLRAVDTLARIGGDEFIVLLPEIKQQEDATNVADKLIKALQGQHAIGSHSLYITTSIGIASYPDHSDSVESIIKNADIAMYKAKESGRNSWLLYHSDMSSHVAELMTLEQDLRNAVETMDEFELYYQPKVNLATGEVCGAEALIRWNHPKEGLVYPDSFIPLAESTGMITVMGRWIIKSCAEQIVRWEEQSLVPLRIAINLSGRQFQDSALITTIKEMIEEYSLDPSLLEFEITESLSMSNIEGTLRTMHELKHLGVSIAIDDFGTGYSSLAYLKQFPIDIVKIDKSFVMDMVDNDDDKVIVQTIVSMSHTLNYKTVAEGVESEGHLQLLRDMDCDAIQGYHFSKPLPIEQFDQYLAAV